MRYAFAYEENNADSRPADLCRAQASRGRRGTHAHRRGRTRAAAGPRVARAGAQDAREPSLLRPGPVPREPGGPRRGRGGGAPLAHAPGGVMVAIDASVLAYAVNRFAPEHARAAEVLEELANRDQPWAIPW